MVTCIRMPAYRIDRYILSGHDPILCEDLARWAMWMESPHRLVQDTQLIDTAHNRVRVCTAFLGVDVNFGDGAPILFETVIFGGYCDEGTLLEDSLRLLGWCD